MYIRDMLRAVTMKRQDANTQELYTPWGEALDPAQVLQEYPRPQMRRGNYTLLNGFWDYAFTDADAEKPEHWDGSILVPFSPESLLSGVGRQLLPHERLWYHRSLPLTKPNDGARLLLHFGAVDQDCTIWLNDTVVGAHRGGYLPFTLDVTDAVVTGENQLVLAVRDVSDTSYRTRGKQKLESGGIFYTAQSGIWQTVWLEQVPKVYIRSLRITPQSDCKRVRIEAQLSAPAKCCTLEIPLSDAPLCVSCQGEVDFTVELPHPHLWSPEDPYLYSFSLTADEDRVESYFALRWFSSERDETGLLHLCLNHKPYPLNGVLDQGYWSDGLMTAPSDEALIYDIQAMKDLGFNLLRKHAKVECLRWYYHCDRLGMVVWQDMPNGGTEYDMLWVNQLPTLFPRFTFRDNDYKKLSRESAESREEWTSECEDMILQLYNSPCIGAWVLFNEGWGQFDAASAVQMARSLDDTRIIDATSGWLDQKCGDVESVHNYFRRQYLRTPQERAFVISEYGGYTCHVPGHSYSEGTYGYRLYPDAASFRNGYEALTRGELGPLWDKGLSAAVFTQLSDIEEETNGILTYDRRINKLRPKGDR